MQVITKSHLIISIYPTFLFLPVCLEGFSFGRLSVNFPIDAVDFLAKTKALFKWSFDGASVGVRPTPGTVRKRKQ